MRTTLQSQLAAMTYLSRRNPKRYKLVCSKYAAYSSDLGYYLFEKLIVNRSKQEKMVHEIVIKPAHRHFD